MTDMVNVESQVNVGSQFEGKVQPSFAIDDTYWGYIVRISQGASTGMVMAQTACMFVGAALVAAVLGLWILPLNVFGADATIMRVGASILFLGFAALFLWFASRGTETELQVDNNLGEVREVVRNRAGKSTLLGRYGFDSIGGVFLDRSAGDAKATLFMRYRNTSQTMLVASGRVADLEPLRDRLGRDMVIGDLAPRGDMSA